jgi:hypothetical protein
MPEMFMDSKSYEPNEIDKQKWPIYRDLEYIR